MSEGKDKTLDPAIESQFMLGSGRFMQGLERVRLADQRRLHIGRLAVLSVVITWLPLLVLAAIEHVAWGSQLQVPLLKDILPYGQLLIAVPILIFGDSIAGRILGWTAAELRRSNVLSPEDTPAFNDILAQMVARWRGRRINILIIVVTCAVTVMSLRALPDRLVDGWQVVGGKLTMSGWWYLGVSLTALRFLELRWLWRVLLWAWVLWRTAGLHLQPQPMHPDRAGGLAFVGASQAVFGVLVFAFGVQLSCLIADAVSYRSADLMAYKGQVIAFVLLVVILLLLPLLVFVPRLVRAREAGLIFVSGAAHHGAEVLEDQLRDTRDTNLPTDDISGLADLGLLYENARLMKPVPMELRHLVVLVLSAVVPFLPLVFLVMSARDVLRMLRGLLV